MRLEHPGAEIAPTRARSPPGCEIAERVVPLCRVGFQQSARALDADDLTVTVLMLRLDDPIEPLVNPRPTDPGRVGSFQSCLTEAVNDIGPKLTYSCAACRVAMGTYPASKPGGGVTIKAGSISANFPIVGGAR